MKKQFLLLAMCIATILSANGQTSVWDGSHTTWTKGNGTQANPYLIENAAQLAHLAYVVNNGIGAGVGNLVCANMYFKLTTDIDLKGTQSFQWTPIGYYTSNTDYYAFGGNFDGNGKTISNLFINTTLYYIGLFGYTDGASMKGIGITGNSSVTGNSYAGGIIGYANNTMVDNCYNRGNVSSNSYSNSYSGGIVGYISGTTTIINCYNTGNISSSNYSSPYYSCSGGIMGYIGGTTTITNCYNTGNVSSNSYYSYYSYSGGIVGYIGRTTTITNCYNVGTINSNGVGYGIASGGTINSYYLVTCGATSGGVSKTEVYMKTAEFVTLLNNEQGFTYKSDITPYVNNGYPVLTLFDMQLRPTANITQTKAALKCLLRTGDVNIKTKQLVCNNQTINLTSTDTLLTHTVSGLTPNTQYSYTFRAINADNDICELTGSFKTLAVTTTTQDATNITQAKATLNSEVVFGDASVTKGFEYKLSTETNYTKVNVSGSSSNLSYNLTNLQPGKTYQFRTFYTFGGNTAYGIILSFNTLTVATTTLDVTSITQTKATLNGEVVFGDATVTAKGFEYKLSIETDYTKVNVSGSSSSFFCNLMNLQPGKTYQFRTFCILGGNTVYGTERNFTTLEVTAITNPATTITRSTATLSGSINAGDATVIEQGFIINGKTVAVNNASATLTYNATNLPRGATSNYQTYCTTAGGTVYGAVQTFTTLAFNTDGTDYFIEDKEDLLLLATLVNGGNSFSGRTFRLKNDITLPVTPNNILSIGNKNTNCPFSGTFHGNGKRIYNVYIDEPNTPYQGFFGYTKNAYLYEVGLVNITASGRNYTGGMVAYAENTRINDSYVSGGTLFALSYCGGLVGYQTSGTNSIISGCYNTCTVAGNNYVGGLLGYSDEGTVRNSYAAALVTGNGSGVGAIIGGAQDVLNYNCYFNDSITGQPYAIGENNISLRAAGEGNMSSGNMRMQTFVGTLNQGLVTPVWKADYEEPINNGFPILIWQTNKPTGVEQVSINNNLTLYPNPAKDYLFIQSASPVEKVEIYNQSGACVLVTGNPTEELNVSDLADGFYLVRIYTEGISVTRKIIIKK